MVESVIIPLARLKELEAAAAETLALKEKLKKVNPEHLKTSDTATERCKDKNARRRELYRLKKAAAVAQTPSQPQKPDVSESEAETG